MSKQLAPLDELKQSITSLKPQFKAALPQHITVEKFTRVLLTAVSTNNQLQQANRTSLFSACMKSAQDGLLPDGREAAIVTFKSKDGTVNAQYMPMISGILKKVRNSGELSSITSQIVYEKDSFKYWVDADGEHLNHEPNLFGERGKEIGVYALAKTKDGGVYVEVLTTEQVDAVRKASRTKDSGPWAGDFKSEMWRKTALKRLAKRLPMSTDLEHTMHVDDDLETETHHVIPQTEETAEVKEVTPKTKKTKPSKLAEIIDAETDGMPATGGTIETNVSEDMLPL